MVLLISAGAGLLLLLFIAALLVDMRALRKIELSATNLDHDWRILKEMNDRAERAIDERPGG